jgi:KEOPS complex subunit Cgi121
VDKIKGYNWFVSIGGFTSSPAGDVEELLSILNEAISPSVFQVFDANFIAGPEHLFFAAVNAVKAFQTSSAISRNLSIEVILYVSCHDQISRALDITGVTPSTNQLALLILAKNKETAEEAFIKASKILGSSDDSVLELDEKKFERIKKKFDISDLELEAVGGLKKEALTKLIVERGALLPLRR